MTPHRMIPCVDCRRPLNGRRRLALEQHATPRTHYRCRSCEWAFLTKADAGRLADARARIGDGQ